MAVKEKYINLFTDFGFKRVFGEEGNNEADCPRNERIGVVRGGNLRVAEKAGIKLLGYLYRGQVGLENFEFSKPAYFWNISHSLDFIPQAPLHPFLSVFSFLIKTK